MLDGCSLTPDTSSPPLDLDTSSRAPRPRWRRTRPAASRAAAPRSGQSRAARTCRPSATRSGKTSSRSCSPTPSPESLLNWRNPEVRHRARERAEAQDFERLLVLSLRSLTVAVPDLGGTRRACSTGSEPLTRQEAGQSTAPRPNRSTFSARLRVTWVPGRMCTVTTPRVRGRQPRASSRMRKDGWRGTRSTAIGASDHRRHEASPRARAASSTRPAVPPPSAWAAPLPCPCASPRLPPPQVAGGAAQRPIEAHRTPSGAGMRAALRETSRATSAARCSASPGESSRCSREATCPARRGARPRGARPRACGPSRRRASCRRTSRRGNRGHRAARCGSRPGILRRRWGTRRGLRGRSPRRGSSAHGAWAGRRTPAGLRAACARAPRSRARSRRGPRPGRAARGARLRIWRRFGSVFVALIAHVLRTIENMRMSRGAPRHLP